MTDADRLLRQRDKQQGQERAAATARAERDAAASTATLKGKVARERRDVLRLLEEQQYPGMEGLSIQRPRLGLEGGPLGYKRVRVAGWKICAYQGKIQGDPYTGQIYLISNGNFVLTGGYGNAERDLDEIKQWHGDVLQGLKALRQRLDKH